jgi:hypothetical protein
MAFGKKKDDASGDGWATRALRQEAPEADAAVDDAGPLEGAELDALAPAVDAEAVPAEEPAVAEAPAAPEASSTDALLSMFKETKAAVDDLALLTGLAGETDIDDILEELRTLRAALGITDAFDDDLAA